MVLTGTDRRTPDNRHIGLEKIPGKKLILTPFFFTNPGKKSRKTTNPWVDFPRYFQTGNRMPGHDPTGSDSRTKFASQEGLY
jgi:hypothetical protein